MKKLSRRLNNKVRPDPGKSQCQLWHAKKRARERLGISLTDDLIAQIVSCAKKQKDNTEFTLEFLEAQSNRVYIYNLTFTGKDPIKLVFDRFRSTIVTFLFPGDYDVLYHYRDIFGNNLSFKHEIGDVAQLWDTDLKIPGETIDYDNGVWTVTEGNLKDKRFIYENNELLEII